MKDANLGKSHIDGDYFNEVCGLVTLIDVTLEDMDVEEGADNCGYQGLSRVTDDQLRETLSKIRENPELKNRRMRTIEQRLLHSSSLQQLKDPEAYQAVAEWIKENSEVVVRQNELVHIINTTKDMSLFKAAINEMIVFMGREPVFDTNENGPVKPETDTSRPPSGILSKS